MNVKTFHGPSIAEALAKVKQELGSSAVILHTRSFKRGGIMGLGARTIVEITAGTGAAQKKRPMAAAAKSRNGDSGVFANAGAATAVAERHVLRNAYSSTRPAASSASTPAPSTRDLATTLLKEPVFELRNELSSLRTMVESLLQRTSRVAGQRSDLPEQLGKLYAQLIEQQVSDEIAIRVIDDVKAELAPEQLSNANAVRERLLQKIEQLIPANLATSAARPNTGAGCRSICLIGPTGVGKTTTIAKLAAAFKLRQRKKVGLITIDTYRIAAVDQLRTYANIIGVPLKVVLTPAELVTAMKEMSDCDVILIDTAGRAQSDQPKLNELSHFVHAAQPSEVHLVLSSTTHPEAMEAALEEFGRVRVDQIIFTKLDEAVSFGVLLNVARKASKALSYITTGQDVPDNIEVGQPRRLAKLILGEKL